MKLDMIIGPSGSGKSQEIMQRVKVLLEKGVALTGNLRDKIIILVPDQYTVTTERFYLDNLGEKAMPFIKILSIKRLASFVFTEFGLGNRGFISGGGRNAMMMKAIHSVSHHFEYYPSEKINPRFMTLMSQAASDFKQSTVSPDTLRKIAQEENDPKLLDISLCYEAYSAFMEKGSFDDADILSVFAELISEKRLFENSNIFCESFRIFTPLELKVLEAFILSGANLTISLPGESAAESKLSLFSTSGECIRRLKGIALRCDIKPGVTVKEEIIRKKSEELKLFQKGLFREEKKVFEEEPEAVSLYKANDLYDEAEYIAAKITQYVRDDGYRYDDIMVIAREIESYAPVLEPVFDRYGIPLFYHKKTPMKKKSVILFIRTLFDIVVNNVTRESVLTLMKTGLTGISVEDISLFENYTVQWSISYDRLLKDFSFSVKGYSETPDTEDDKALLKRINETREKITDIISFFKNQLKKQNTVKEISTALYNVFNYVDLPKRLEELESEYKTYGEEELAAEQKQVYDLVIDSIDEFVKTSGDDVVTAEEYLEVFISVIENGKIGIIPVFANAVVAGGAETTPYASPKILFLMGLTSGAFPKTETSISIIDQKDKIRLEKYDISIGKSDTEKVLYERFLAYYAISAPSEKLNLSYNVGGADSAPSPIISEALSIFPLLEEKSFPNQGDEEAILSRFQNIDSAYELCKKYNITSLDGYFRSKGFMGGEELKPDYISKENAEKLFGKNQTLSASRVTNFYKCRFGYFFRYGMNLQKKRLAKLDAIETGNFIHAALNYAFEHGPNGTDEELEEILKAFAEAYFKNLFGDEPLEAGQKKHFEELLRRVLRLLKMFREELKNTKFEPFAYELEVSYENGVRPVRIPYEDGYVTMVGKIDRVDIYERNGEKFVRVIDYKSGRKSFSIEELFYGLDIQMLVYLYALHQNGASVFGSNPSVAGCMYVNVNPATVKINRNEGMTSAEKKLEETKKRSGIFLNDADVLRAMDPERRGKYIPVKENDLKSLATAEEFGKIFLKIQSLLKTMAKETSSGNIYKNPVIHGLVDACEYCDYAEYCEHAGCERGLSKVNYENIYDLIDKEVKEGKNGL